MRMRLNLLLFAVLVPVAAACSNGRDRDPGAPADVGAVPAEAQRSASGLAWRVLRPGTGTRHPRPNSEVTVHYTGWTTDGMKFDSSRDSGQPATFTLDGVIRGWTEGVQMMVEGETRRFWVPAELAYGPCPGGSKPCGLLVFDIELVRIGN
jgi:FKBP-type peptidyl-prolyl cis-trans isomerase